MARDQESLNRSQQDPQKYSMHQNTVLLAIHDPFHLPPLVRLL